MNCTQKPAKQRINRQGKSKTQIQDPGYYFKGLIPEDPISFLCKSNQEIRKC
jgi:hypothetical protein